MAGSSISTVEAQRVNLESAFPTTEYLLEASKLIAGKAIIWASAAVAFPFVPFRLFVRWKIAKKLFIDDGLVVIAYCLLLAYAIMWQNVAYAFYLVFDSLSGRIPRPTNGFHYLQIELHVQVTAVILYGICLWCIKLAFLFFFQRLGNHVRRQRTLWWFVLGYNLVSFAIWIALPPWRCIAASPETTMGMYIHLGLDQTKPYRNSEMR